MTLFKYPEDKIPVLIILAFSALDFTLYFLTDNAWLLAGYWLLMIIPKGVISAWNHHHQHCHVFKQKPLNRILEFFYALHTGVTTNLWVLHHNLGHHRHFLDQAKDESRWKRKSGKKMGRLEYTLSVTLTAYYRGFIVGNQFPKLQKEFVVYSLITLGILIALTIYNPVGALFLFILPMIMSLLFTSSATYNHHVGLDTQDQFAGSYNVTATWYNLLTGNLGYHTAHHFKQGVHWAKLPELHAKIADKIPEHCYTNSKFDVLSNKL